MKFSVLIAHYNNSDYFKDCFESLQNQTYQKWEAIILDDASKPEEKKAVQELIKNDCRFKFYENEKNYGVGVTKAKLIELATGEICGFVDPDDGLVENAIEVSVNCYRNIGIIATYSKMLVCDQYLKPQKLFSHTRKIENRDLNYFNIRFEVSHFFTFKKSVFKRTSGINQDITSSVDQDLYLKLYDLGDFYFIKEPLYLYRRHEKGVSQDLNKKKKLYENWDLVLRDTLERRNMQKLYGKEVESIESLPEFIFKKQNTFFHKLKRKLQKWGTK